jgi:hypothetical protein
VIFGTNNGGAFKHPIFQANLMGFKNFSERKNISYVSNFFEYVGKKSINIYNEVTAILDLSKTKFDIN